MITSLDILNGILESMSLFIQSYFADMIIILFLSIVFYYYFGYYFFLRVLIYLDKKIQKQIGQNKEQENDTLNSLPLVSVIVPTYNEERNIEKKLKTLANLDYPRDALEIIFVDDGSNDSTVQLLLKFKNSSIVRNLPIKVYKLSHKGPGFAYFFGSKNAQGDFILWTDADVLLSRKSLLTGIKILLKQKNVGAVCSRTLPIASQQSNSIRDVELKFRDKLRTIESYADSIIFSNANFYLFRKKFVDKIDTNAINYDASLTLNILKEGYRVLFVNDILAYHDEPKNIKIQLKRRKRIFLGLFQLFSQGKKLLFNKNRKYLGFIIAPRNIVLSLFEPLLFVISIILIVAKLIVYVSRYNLLSTSLPSYLIRHNSNPLIFVFLGIFLVLLSIVIRNFSKIKIVMLNILTYFLGYFYILPVYLEVLKVVFRTAGNEEIFKYTPGK